MSLAVPLVSFKSFATVGPAVDVFIPLLFPPWCPCFGVPSLLLIRSLLLLVYPMFLLVPVVVVFLLLLASLLLLVYTVGDSVIAVAVLLL